MRPPVAALYAPIHRPLVPAVGEEGAAPGSAAHSTRDGFALPIGFQNGMLSSCGSDSKSSASSACDSLAIA
jgi:hypothetical protein